jgi:Bacterial SH3 domain
MAPARSGGTDPVKKTLPAAAQFGTLLLAFALIAAWAGAQAPPLSFERTFTSPATDVERVVRNLRPSWSGRLPTVDGFVEASDLPIDHYERGYYACTFQVVATPAGGATVRASAKITAWYNDPTPARSGYRVLVSNGHIENDFLDQIQDALGPAAVPKPSGAAVPAGKLNVAAAPPISNGGLRPQTRLDLAPLDAGESSSNKGETSRDFSRGPTQPAGTPAPPLPSGPNLESLKLQRAAVDKRAQELSADIKNFEDILHNQVQPANLATVKKTGTRIFSKPADSSPVLFSADAEDEFQVLELEGAWVHVQISGSSRGWIRRAQLDLPAEYADSSAAASDSAPVATAALFNISKDETTTFGGKWAPLATKKVRVIWLEPASASAGSTAKEKLAFARALFQKSYSELKSSGAALDGVVIVFDSADGGQIAATIAGIKALVDGSLAPGEFWRQCSLDPPESFQDSAKK